ncbi:MAG: hypothetical protein AAF403_03225, partial [Pseudomonadota bacterium]
VARFHYYSHLKSETKEDGEISYRTRRLKIFPRTDLEKKAFEYVKMHANKGFSVQHMLTSLAPYFPEESDRTKNLVFFAKLLWMMVSTRVIDPVYQSVSVDQIIDDKPRLIDLSRAMIELGDGSRTMNAEGAIVPCQEIIKTIGMIADGTRTIQEIEDTLRDMIKDQKVVIEYLHGENKDKKLCTHDDPYVSKLVAGSLRGLVQVRCMNKFKQ